MQKIIFLVLKKLKNTESAQLWHWLPSALGHTRARGGHESSGREVTKVTRKSGAVSRLLFSLHTVQTQEQNTAIVTCRN